MGFHVKEAVPLSHVGVFGSVFAQNLVNLPRRHPLTDARPLVDAEVACLLMPCLLFGHSFGCAGTAPPRASSLILSR